MYIDSHCHLDRIDLAPYQNDFACFMETAKYQGVEKMLSVCIDMESYPDMLRLIETHDSIVTSVGVHPNVQNQHDPTVDELIQWGKNSRVVAIGETGLDYFRCEGDMQWQQDRFRHHIRAAICLQKPLIIHTRNAANDTLKILKQEGAERVGGVIHCFTENWAFAEKALEMNFYISFSGIVTFKNAREIQETAAIVPEDKYLIETDSPYLAPVPFRGKPNYPIFVKHVAEKLAELRESKLDIVANQSRQNFFDLFGT